MPHAMKKLKHDVKGNNDQNKPHDHDNDDTIAE